MSKLIRRTSAALAVLMLMAGAVACGEDDGSSSPGGSSESPGGSEGGSPADDSLDPIVIGWANMDNGTPSFPDATTGARAAVSYINAELGGIGGRPVELQECSVGDDPESNQRCGQQFANDDAVELVMTGFLFNGGPFYGALAASDKLVVGRIPLTSADFTADNALFFGYGAPGSVAGLPQFFASRDDIESVGILSLDSESGRLSTDALKTSLEAEGKSVEVTVVNEASADFVAALTSLSGTDAIFVGLTAAGALQIAQNQDLLDADTLMVGTTAAVNSEVWDQVPSGQEGWIYGSGELSADMGEGVDDFVDEFLANFEEHAAGGPDGSDAIKIFGNLLFVRDVLEGVGADALDATAIDEAFRGYEGTVPGVVGDVRCGSLSELPSVCAQGFRMFQVEEGKVRYLDDTVIDTADQ